ncbi:MAG: hypothetical protein V1811_00490 [Candidatus Micrarchaeota archaeon]
MAEDVFHNASSILVATLLGYSLLVNNIQLLLALLILVAVFYVKPGKTTQEGAFGGREFSI